MWKNSVPQKPKGAGLKFYWGLTANLHLRECERPSFPEEKMTSRALQKSLRSRPCVLKSAPSSFAPTVPLAPRPRVRWRNTGREIAELTPPLLYTAWGAVLLRRRNFQRRTQRLQTQSAAAAQEGPRVAVRKPPAHNGRNQSLFIRGITLQRWCSVRLYRSPHPFPLVLCP